MSNYGSEFLGTLLLAVSLGLTVDPLSSGFLLTALIYAGAGFSGAHFNPAVTLSFWAAKEMPSGQAGGYILSQLLGAVGGGFMLLYLTGSANPVTPPFTSSPLQYSLIETLFTFILALLYLQLFLHERYRKVPIHGLVIGLSYAGLIAAGDSVSGAIFNPALAAGHALTELLSTGEIRSYLITYILAPLLGGVFAGLLYTHLRKRPKTPF